MDRICFELCAETMPACLAAVAGGAHRIELCSALDVGGLTPDWALAAAAVRQCPIPVHVLLRPNADDDFRSSPAVVDALAASIDIARDLGVAGFVMGLLRWDGTVDVEAMRGLVGLAAPLPVTFHRAFDATPDLLQALEDVVVTGCSRVLTSGGQTDVLRGATMLAHLVEQAGDRVEVAVGGGLRTDNATVVARLTDGRHFHGSLRNKGKTGDAAAPSAERVREMIDRLRAGVAMSLPERLTE